MQCLIAAIRPVQLGAASMRSAMLVVALEVAPQQPDSMQPLDVSAKREHG